MGVAGQGRERERQRHRETDRRRQRARVRQGQRQRNSPQTGEGWAEMHRTSIQGEEKRRGDSQNSTAQRQTTGLESEQRQTGRESRPLREVAGAGLKVRHEDGMAELKSNPAAPTPSLPGPGTWSASSLLMAKASWSCSSSSPLLCGHACSASGGAPEPTAAEEAGKEGAVRCKEDRGAQSPTCLRPARPHLGLRHKILKVWGRGLCPSLSSPTGRDRSEKDSPADEGGYLGSF